VGRAVICDKQLHKLMFKHLTIMGAALLVAVLVSGCAGAQNKLGRGVNNSLEPLSLSEWQRSVEQTSLFESPQKYHTGMVRGFTRTMARTGLGIYEIVTFPIPNQFNPKAQYDPIWTSYLTPTPGYPDSYKPGLPDSPTFRTDDSLGFSGGEVAPFIPGSRFRIMDN
jgi:putative exosortase-associated protein (TIGR04073 family)